jgi:hypothetical protein
MKMNTERIEKLAKEIRVKPDVIDHDRIIADAADTLERTTSARALAARLSLWRKFMNSRITKLAAAAVIVSIWFCITKLDNSSVAWAEVAQRFESVPFFNVTIYLGNDNSAQAQKINIWKSESSRVRTDDGNIVIFADFSNGNSNITALDKTTKQPVNSGGTLARILLETLCSQGRFSLNTILESCPCSTDDVKPVEVADTAASRETVVFEFKSNSTPEWISILALRESKLPVRLHFNDPRNNEHSDFIFDYSQKKDEAFFDPNAFVNQ